MKAAFVFTFLALLITYVAAQASSTPFYITSPLQGDSFKAGSTISVKWNNGVDGSAKVILLTGTNAATMKPTGYSFTINGADGEYDWKVPTNLPQDATFSLQISYTDPKSKATATSYSAPFTLTGTNGDRVTQSFVTGVSSAISSPIASASSVVSSPAITSVVPSTAAPKPTSASSAVASATPSAPSAAAGYKAPTVAICVVAIIASALFL
ncbi:unnamed protein product [Mucor hiemalis]